MMELFDVIASSKMFFYIMVSFSFFIGIILMVSSEAFESVNRVFEREYGFQKKILPKIEETRINVIDVFIMKNRIAMGLIIAVTSFALLIWFK